MIEELRKSFTVEQTCALAGTPRATYYRWRALLKRGPAALSDGRAGSQRRRRAPAREVHRHTIEVE